MEFPLLSLKLIIDVIKPLIQDLLKDGGKRLISNSKRHTSKKDFYNLYVCSDEFYNNLEKFVEVLSEFISYGAKQGNRFHLNSHYRSKLGKAGSLIKISLGNFERALSHCDPEFKIYGKNIHYLLYSTMEEEWETLREIQNELVKLRTSKLPLKYNSGVEYGPSPISSIPYPEIDEIDITPLLKELENAKSNLNQTFHSIEKLRLFIKENISLDLK
ncbi:MAG: hypothetical protein DWQ05_21900 [Calditrichaeota bacterium]|nr:MAG: hypothetical protein DWQ05_21900 [Calditrichota bacterium]